MQDGLNISAERGAALARAQLIAAWQQPDEASNPLGQWTLQTDQLQAQLLVSEAERQRLQHEYDALSTSHETLIARCSQLEVQLQASQAAQRSSSAAAAEASQQLEMMRQQMEEANSFLAQQQKTNKQQAEQLQQALDARGRKVVVLSGLVTQLSSTCINHKAAVAAAEVQIAALKKSYTELRKQHGQLLQEYLRVQHEEGLAAVVEGYKTEQQQMTQQLADMAAAVAAADAARRSAQRDEAAVLQAMAHTAMQRDSATREVTNLQDQLAAAQAEIDKAVAMAAAAKEELAAAPAMLRQKAAEAEQKAAAAEQKAAVAEALKVRAEIACNDLQARYKRKVDEINPILVGYQHEALEALKVKGQLVSEVAHLRRALQLQQNQQTGPVMQKGTADDAQDGEGEGHKRRRMPWLLRLVVR
jgi:chromosome segregation ATPase